MLYAAGSGLETTVISYFKSWLDFAVSGDAGCGVRCSHNDQGEGHASTSPQYANNGMDAPTLNGIEVPKWKC
jgi:hypothetical protein